MAINYHPKAGTVLKCKFRSLEPPEMVKKRPVIVISPRFRKRTMLCSIIPLSTTKPIPIEKYHYEIFFDTKLPKPYLKKIMWAKCDMVYTVSFNRLDFLMKKTKRGKENIRNTYCLITYWMTLENARLMHSD